MSQTNKSESPVGFEDRPPVVATDPASLAPEHEALLLALDRMLTTGTYYPPGHAQYVAVAEQCASAVGQAMQGQTSIKIEVTTEGLSLGGASVNGEERCARRLHELLEPLNQALLEIHAGATTEELHQGLFTLKEHHKKLVATRDYQEIEIEGMPETVTVMGRSLYVRIMNGNGPEQTDSPINEYFDPNLIPDTALVPTPSGQMLERDFLAVVQGLIKCGDLEKMRELMDADDDKVSEILGTWVPDFAIKTIKEILEALDRTNSDPMLLQHLIAHAQSALALTGDADVVELVFEKLRKENTKPKSQPLLEKRPKPKNKPTRFTLSRAELRSLIDEVQVTADEKQTEESDLVSPSNADCLGICIQVMHVAPTKQLADGIAASLRTVLGAQELGDVEKGIITKALVSVFKNDAAETTDLIASMLSLPVRRSHLKELGPLWLTVWQGLETLIEKERAWPYIVNDLLMGLEWPDHALKIELYEALSSIAVNERSDLLKKLETLRALQEKILAPDLFHARAPLLYGVHQLLMNSSLAEMHGPQMHQRLAYQKAHPMVSVLLDGFTGYNQAHRNAYQAILAQGVKGEIEEDLQEITIRHLKGTLSRLPAERRNEPWVADAIRLYGQMGGGNARPVIELILKEKKFFVWPAWPKSCRQVARDVLAGKAHVDERNHGVDDI